MQGGPSVDGATTPDCTTDAPNPHMLTCLGFRAQGLGFRGLGLLGV